jgi:hypothetical protein
MKQTNEQQQSNFAMESIILKGIATSINAMIFPKFQHLNQMLEHFGYKLTSFDEPDLYEYIKLNEFILQKIQIRIENDNVNLLTDLYSSEKKYILIKNVVNAYNDDIPRTSPVIYSFSSNEQQQILEICEKISDNYKIGITAAPVFIHANRSFSVGTVRLIFSDFLQLIGSTDKEIIIYNFKIVDNFAFLR